MNKPLPETKGISKVSTPTNQIPMAKPTPAATTTPAANATHTATAAPTAAPQLSFADAFKNAYKSKEETFHWTNPKTGKDMLYKVELAKKTPAVTPRETAPALMAGRDIRSVEKNEPLKPRLPKTSQDLV